MKRKNYQIALVPVALILSLVGLLPGCSSQKTISGIERVNQNQESLEQSDKKIAKAQSELTHFQDSLKDLRDSFKETESSRSQSGASDALGRLSLRTEQAQLDLKEVRSQNEAAMRDLDTRLKEAASENKRVLETGTH